jgi:hypothetical protein
LKVRRPPWNPPANSENNERKSPFGISGRRECLDLHPGLICRSSSIKPQNEREHERILRDFSENGAAGVINPSFWAVHSGFSAIRFLKQGFRTVRWWRTRFQVYGYRFQPQPARRRTLVYDSVFNGFGFDIDGGLSDMPDLLCMRGFVVIAGI